MLGDGHDRPRGRGFIYAPRILFPTQVQVQHFCVQGFTPEFQRYRLA
ncbi:hypothetical protein HMPREF0004_2280 [Achromobacter piechaudii ATCC 43553]|uniref:Uncharacterized protein n=1 Tax=Achromobacter piechaudii ATCC 43553 TaxID=742159 RepID=D4X9Y3_9BURK|nr:hypothetical protein HMPREF0004_2280 [Achromobacter piechaudii ATCC 43553]